MKVRVIKELRGRRGAITPVGTIMEGPDVAHLIDSGLAVEVTDGDKKQRFEPKSKSWEAPTPSDDSGTDPVPVSLGTTDDNVG